MLHKNQGLLLLLLLKEETQLLPVLTGTDVEDRRGGVESEAWASLATAG